MRKRGELFVFEGPDGVGKSTLSAEFTARLRSYDIETEHFSFPGREEGTLGRLVYDLHHAPADFGVQAVSAISLQTMHIAAHLDAIERRILPALFAGKNVVLDRFWWSTWVYGIVGGVSASLLKTLLRVERECWGKVVPTTAFLVTKAHSWRQDESDDTWQRLATTYQELAQRERSHYPVELVANEDSLKVALEAVLEAARTHSSSKRLQVLAQVELEPQAQKETTLTTLLKRQPPKTTLVFDTYWKFAAERQAVFFRRLRGEDEPWSDDAIFQKHKFTNAYRASDRVSQFLIRHVIYRQDAAPDGVTADGADLEDPDEIFFRVMLFKVFNRVSTWRALERELGEVSFADYSFDRYATLLSDLRNRGERIFSSAYIMPSGSSSFGYADKHRNYLTLLERMIEDGVPWRLTELKTMQQAFELLLSYPTMGKFLAYQFVTDLNYSPLTDFSETEFVMPGPGALDGITKCFADLNGWEPADAIRWVTERQGDEFAARHIAFQDLWGRPLQLIDCQNLFCEVDKYARVAHPTVQGLSGRTRIKQLFQPMQEQAAPVPWYPPKWGLNDRIPVAVEAGNQASRSRTRASTSQTPALPFDEF